MKLIKLFMFSISLILFSGCGAYFNQPIKEQVASIGEKTAITNSLKQLPLAEKKIVVGVYKFRDQTGQYKPSDNGSNFSTAVTQGSTSILIKALEDSNWFIPIERENLSNLLQERNIIRSTRQEYLKGTNANEQQLAPLLYAGVLIEGGIVSYDSNIITGGFGARYFGAGASTRYRQDRVTVYLRLVSTSSGEILKTIYVSKTILSQSIDASLFRYVKFKRLLEVETGFTKNEPIQLAVTEAIEKAVEGLVIEGIKEDVWKANAPISELTELINNYENEKIESESTLLHSRYLKERRAKFGFDLAAGAALIQGDYPSAVLKPALRSGLRYFILPNFNINSNANLFWVGNKNKFEEGHVSLDLNLEVLVLPNDALTPFVYIGGGFGTTTSYDTPYWKIQSGIGLEYLLTDTFGLKTFGEINLTQTDKLDNVISGIRDDNYWRFGVGISYYFPKAIYKDKVIKKHIKELSEKSKILDTNLNKQ